MDLGSFSTGWALDVTHATSVKSLRMVPYKPSLWRTDLPTRIPRNQRFQAQVCLSPKLETSPGQLFQEERGQLPGRAGVLPSVGAPSPQLWRPALCLVPPLGHHTL